jgi:hypothetical protein
MERCGGGGGKEGRESRERDCPRSYFLLLRTDASQSKPSFSPSPFVATDGCRCHFRFPSAPPRQSYTYMRVRE